jgi:hypothetical protein
VASEDGAWPHYGRPDPYSLSPDDSPEILSDDKAEAPVVDWLAHLCRCRPVNSDEFLADAPTMVLIIGADHRQMLRDAGWSKADVRSYLHPKISAPTRGRTPWTSSATTPRVVRQ